MTVPVKITPGPGGLGASIEVNGVDISSGILSAALLMEGGEPPTLEVSIWAVPAPVLVDANISIDYSARDRLVIHAATLGLLEAIREDGTDPIKAIERLKEMSA